MSPLVSLSFSHYQDTPQTLWLYIIINTDVNQYRKKKNQGSYFLSYCPALVSTNMQTIFSFISLPHQIKSDLWHQSLDFLKLTCSKEIKKKTSLIKYYISIMNNVVWPGGLGILARSLPVSRLGAHLAVRGGGRGRGLQVSRGLSQGAAAGLRGVGALQGAWVGYRDTNQTENLLRTRVTCRHVTSHHRQSNKHVGGSGATSEHSWMRHKTSYSSLNLTHVECNDSPNLRFSGFWESFSVVSIAFYLWLGGLSCISYFQRSWTLTHFQPMMFVGFILIHFMSSVLAGSTNNTSFKCCGLGGPPKYTSWF